MATSDCYYCSKTSLKPNNKTDMITLELAQQFLYDKRTQIYSPHSHWVKEYKVISVTIRSEFGFDEWIFICEYWDNGFYFAKVTAPISQFNSWLEERRENQITQLV